jgi:hypothetical protein
MSIYSDGFADAGPTGAARQAKLVARARELGVRLLGPNSMGVVNIPGRMALTVNAVLEMESPPSGTTSIVSQSGTMLGTVLSRGAARGLGFAKLVSLGNEADLGAGEIVELLADDPQTRSSSCFSRRCAMRRVFPRLRARRMLPGSRWSRTSSAGRAWGKPSRARTRERSPARMPR